LVLCKKLRLGLGIPCQVAGVAVFATYAALLFGVRQIISTPAYRPPYVIGVTVMLILIVVWKGERPLRWRWGKD
jgi:hypothetical protein